MVKARLLEGSCVLLMLSAGCAGSVTGEVATHSAVPVVRMGSLDKDVIRNVIKRNLEPIRSCYETQLALHPGIAGRVKTNFVIAPTGHVQAAEIVETTLGNAEVEGCITDEIRRWRFPEPNGNGIVIVKYPFLFKTAE